MNYLLFMWFAFACRAMETWKDYDELNYFLEDKCLDTDCSNFIEDYKKKSETLPLLTESSVKKSSRLPPFYHSSHPTPCSCGIEFRVLDLGHQYYPRYLHTGVCKSEICGGLYRCVEKHYKVRVLKQHDPRNSDLKPSTNLPENLRGFWQSELIPVTVACECSL